MHKEQINKTSVNLFQPVQSVVYNFHNKQKKITLKGVILIG